MSTLFGAQTERSMSIRVEEFLTQKIAAIGSIDFKATLPICPDKKLQETVECQVGAYWQMCNNNKKWKENS